MGAKPINPDIESIAKKNRDINMMASNLIRNFTKERYLWGEV